MSPTARIRGVSISAANVAQASEQIEEWLRDGIQACVTVTGAVEDGMTMDEPVEWAVARALMQGPATGCAERPPSRGMSFRRDL